MRKLIIFTLLFAVNICSAQSIIYRDNMESVGRTWKGVPKTLVTSGYIGGNSSANDLPASTPLYNSIDTCFRLSGIGLGSSGLEKDTLLYTNVTGLNTTSTYTLRFRLASVSINPTTNLAAGVDASDYVLVEYSSNGGSSFIQEIKVLGGSNSYWPFSSLGSTLKSANGSVTNFTSTTSSPLSLIQLSLPTGVSQLSFRIIMAANAIGESWLVDDVELIETVVLPIELIHFSATLLDGGVQLNWQTAVEINNDYFILLKSFDGINFVESARIDGSGNTYSVSSYSYIDFSYCEGIAYYKLRQVDYNHDFQEYNMVAIKCPSPINNRPKMIINYLGQEVDSDYIGYKLYIYR